MNGQTTVSIPLVLLISSSFAFSSMLFTVTWNELDSRTENVYIVPEIKDRVESNGDSIKQLIGEVGIIKGFLMKNPGQ